MRKIVASQIIVFLLLLLLVLALSIASTYCLIAPLPLGDFRGVALTFATLLFVYIYALLVYRLLLNFFPLRPGEIPNGSQQEFIYHVYLLSFLILFYPILRSGFVPVPIMRVVYLSLGARLGRNTYSSGIILDPLFVEIGENTIVGQYALLVPHVIEGARLAHFPIRIGNGVTIGAHSAVLSDVVIGDNAIVATGAVVPKGTRIGAGEVWGGVPAKRLK